MNAFHAVSTITERARRHGLQESTTRAALRASRVAVMPLAARSLQRRRRSVSSIDEALDLAYGFSFGGVVFGPWQERSEIRSLLSTVSELQPKTILEIGTSNGGSLFLFAHVAASDALIVSVDLPHGEFGGGYPRWRGRLYRSFATEGQRIRLLRADSHDPSTLEAVHTALEGREVDLLFIDGDHTYAGVRSDFEMYGSLVREGGLVAFHDIVPMSPNGPRPRNDDDLQGGEVPQFWAELRSSHDVSEFVEDWDSGRFGIGALTVARQRTHA